MAMRVRYIVLDGEIISETRNGVERDYGSDPQGNVIALYDSSQNKTDTWTYWPYGEVKTRTGTTATPFQYIGTRGYYQDSSTKSYVRARYLDVQKGRWMTEDPVGFAERSWNLYGYVGGNPFTADDPSGFQARPIAIPIAGPPNRSSPINLPTNCAEVTACLTQPSRPRCSCSTNFPVSTNTMLCVLWQESSFSAPKSGGLGSATPPGFDSLRNGHKCQWLQRFKDFKDFKKNATACEKIWRHRTKSNATVLRDLVQGQAYPVTIDHQECNTKFSVVPSV